MYSKYLRWRRSPKNIKLGVYFIYLLAFSSTSQYLMNRHNHQSTGMAIYDSLLSGLIFACSLTVIVYFSRERFKKITKSKNIINQSAILRQAIRTSELPKDAHTISILPEYISHTTKMNKRTRFLSPLLFGFMSLLSIYVAVSEKSPDWIIMTLFFIIIGIYCYEQPNRQNKKLEILASKLRRLN